MTKLSTGLPCKVWVDGTLWWGANGDGLLGTVDAIWAAIRVLVFLRLLSGVCLLICHLDGDHLLGTVDAISAVKAVLAFLHHRCRALRGTMT